MIFGKTGQLGQVLENKLNYPDVLSYGRNLADFTKPQQVRRLVSQHRPQIIINAAAYTQVDQAETDPETANLVNAVTPAALAEESKKIGAVFIHYSTDYVFDGQKDQPYVETDTTNSLNSYGSSKLQGEINIQQVGGKYLILRTSWVYNLQRDNFVTKVLKWARNHKQLNIVADQFGSPTWASHLASATVKLISKDSFIEQVADKSGIYHLAGRGQVSRYDFTLQILSCDPSQSEHIVEEIIPVASSNFPAPASRPPFTALDCSKFESVFGFQMPDWEDSLAAALKGE